jgi:hypothetical protein
VEPLLSGAVSPTYNPSERKARKAVTLCFPEHFIPASLLNYTLPFRSARCALKNSEMKRWEAYTRCFIKKEYSQGSVALERS